MDFNQILLTREPPTGVRSKCYNILSEAQLALRLTQSLQSKYPHSEHQIKNVRICGHFLSGGADGDRTHDLQIANLSLSQLSYSPKGCSKKLKMLFKNLGRTMRLELTTTGTTNRGSTNWATSATD